MDLLERLNALKAKKLTAPSAGDVAPKAAADAAVPQPQTSTGAVAGPSSSSVAVPPLDPTATADTAAESVGVGPPEDAQPPVLTVDPTVPLRYRDPTDVLNAPFTSRQFVADFVNMGADRRRQRPQEMDVEIDVQGLPLPPCRDVECYEPDVHLDKGEYGDVFKATEVLKGPSVLFAVKQIKRARLDEYKSGFPGYLLREFDLVMRMRHRNVISGVEVVCKTTIEQPPAGAAGPLPPLAAPLLLGGSRPGMVMSPPPAAGGCPPASQPGGGKRSSFFLVTPMSDTNLKRYMYDAKGRFCHLSSRNQHPDAPTVFLAKAKCIMVQLLEALACLHQNRILHRDVKPSNVLVSSTGVLQLCDFGLGRLYKEGSKLLTPTVVTLIYRAPELHLGMHDYSNRLDVWAAGCIFAELFLKTPLFRASNEAEHFQRVCDVIGMPTNESLEGFLRLGPMAVGAMKGLTAFNRSSKLALEFSESKCKAAKLLPPSGLAMLQRILQWNPMLRPSAQELLNDPFFAEAPVACTPAALMELFPYADDGSPRRHTPRQPTTTTCASGHGDGAAAAAAAASAGDSQAGATAGPAVGSDAQADGLPQGDGPPQPPQSPSVTPAGGADAYADGFVVLATPPAPPGRSDE